MRIDEYTRHDATALAALIKQREVTASEVLEASIARAEQVNPKLNAIVRPMYADARKQQVDPNASFAGVPMVVKDLLATCAGHPTSFGGTFIADLPALTDSELVARFRRAGLVPIAKTNVPEYGILPTTEPVAYGATRNPFNLDHSTGGSSGGSAACVAAGVVPIGHANDGGGSIRIPASCCGLFGLKPTRGRNPLGPDVGDVVHGFIVEHAVTRTVRDSAALLDLTCGLDLGAPYDAPPRLRPFLDEVGAPVGKLRIAFTTQAVNGAKCDAETDEAVRATAKQLEALGHIVEEASLSFPMQELLAQGFIALYMGGVLIGIDGMAFLSGRTPEEKMFEPLTWAMYQAAKMIPLSQYLLSNALLQRATRAIAQKFVDHDIWLMPNLTRPPEKLGFFANDLANPLGPLFAAADYAPYTPLFNVSGAPAMSVPLCTSKSGLPIGMQFAGRFGDEATLIRLAAQLEAAHPWIDRLPKL